MPRNPEDIKKQRIHDLQRALRKVNADLRKIQPGMDKAAATWKKTKGDLQRARFYWGQRNANIRILSKEVEKLTRKYGADNFRTTDKQRKLDWEERESAKYKSQVPKLAEAESDARVAYNKASQGWYGLHKQQKYLQNEISKLGGEWRI